MRPFSFVAVLVATAVLTVGSVVLGNWWLDPFGRFGRPTDGYYFETERDIKHGLVRSRDAEGLLMGSSKVAEWQPGLLHGRNVLNAAWSAALPEEMYFFLRDVNPRVAFIAMGFDFFMFNAAVHAMVEESEFRSLVPARWSTHLLSLAMLERGLSARDRFLAKQRPVVLPDGARNTHPDEAADATWPRDNAEVLGRLRHRILVNYRFAERRVEYLSRIRDWGTRSCVVIVPFANPMSEAVLALIAEMELEEELSRFRHELRTVFPDVIDLSVAAEWTPEELYWRRDPDHYYPSVGARIFHEKIEPVLQRRIGSGTEVTAARSCEPRDE